MQAFNYWNQFEATGKVTDYLNYCSMEKQEHKQSENAARVETNARSNQCDRDCTKADAYR